MSCQDNINGQDRPHGLYGVGKEDLLVRPSFKTTVSAVVDEVYVPQQRRLGEYQDKYIALWMTKLARHSSFRQQNLHILIRHQPPSVAGSRFRPTLPKKRQSMSTKCNRQNRTRPTVFGIVDASRLHTPHVFTALRR